MPTRLPKLFLSYSRRNLAVATDLMAKLKKFGFEVWHDESSMIAGVKWLEAIDGGIQACDILLVLLSRHATKSEYVQYEWSFAMGAGKIVIPLRLDSCNIHPKLLQLQVLEYNEAAFGRLIEAITTQYFLARSNVLALDFVVRISQLEFVKDAVLGNVDHSKPLHYFVFGFDDVGTAVVKAIAEIAIFPNFKRSRISVFSNEKDRYISFIQRYPNFTREKTPWLFDLRDDDWQCKRPACITDNPTECDCLNQQGAVTDRYSRAVNYVCNADFFQTSGTYIDQHTLAKISDLIAKQDSHPVLVFAGDDPTSNLELCELACLAMSRRLHPDSLRNLSAYVYAPSLKEIRANFDPIKVSLFGDMLSYQLQQTIIEVAIQVHDYYESKYSSERIEWYNLTAEHRNSTLAAATRSVLRAILREKLKVNNLDQRDIFEKAEHLGFVAQRLMEGWNYGDRRDKRKYLSPIICSWESIDDKEVLLRADDGLSIDRITSDCMRRHRYDFLGNG